MNNFCNCTTCDTEFLFPALDVDQNCIGDVSLSQVVAVLILADGATPPSDWTSKTAWADVVDNNDTSNSFVKYVTGVGFVETPEKTQLTVAKGVTINTIKTYTLTLEVFNLSNAQYAFLRSLQCNPTNYTFWIENAGGHLYGGSDGILPFLTDVDFPLLGGENDVEKAVLTIRYRSKCDPDRTYIENLSENFANVSGSKVMGMSETEVFGFSTTQIFGF